MEKRKIEKAIDYIQDSIHEISIELENEKNDKRKLELSKLVDSLENLLVFIEENRR